MQHFQRSVSKALKQPKKLLRNNFPLFLILLGLIIFVFGAVNYYKVRVLSFSKVPESTEDSITNTDIPTEINIPSLNLNLKVEPGVISNGVWQISVNNTSFLKTSLAPGNGGNTVIYGHNKKNIFGNLPYLSIGQKVSVITTTGKVYNYVVDKKYFVNPNRVDLVSPTQEETLTIYTCWGFLDSQRAVVIAKPLF